MLGLITYTNSSSLCRDGSCGSNLGLGRACEGATIGSVVGPSCTGTQSCLGADIDSVDLSCRGRGGNSCNNAQLSGVDLIDSCNAINVASCLNTNINIDILPEVTELTIELIDCCNDVNNCQGLTGINIFAGCVSYCLLYSSLLDWTHSFLCNIMIQPAPSSMPSEVPSQSSEPSEMPSSAPSEVPSDSGKPSFGCQPNESTKVRSVIENEILSP